MTNETREPKSVKQLKPISKSSELFSSTEPLADIWFRWHYTTFYLPEETLSWFNHERYKSCVYLPLFSNFCCGIFFPFAVSSVDLESNIFAAAWRASTFCRWMKSCSSRHTNNGEDYSYLRVPCTAQSYPSKVHRWRLTTVQWARNQKMVFFVVDS